MQAAYHDSRHDPGVLHTLRNGKGALIQKGRGENRDKRAAPRRRCAKTCTCLLLFRSLARKHWNSLNHDPVALVLADQISDLSFEVPAYGIRYDGGDGKKGHLVAYDRLSSCKGK